MLQKQHVHEGIVPTMVDVPIHLANTFDDFQALIEELKNKNLTVTQCLKAQMA